MSREKTTTGMSIFTNLKHSDQATVTLTDKSQADLLTPFVDISRAGLNSKRTTVPPVPLSPFLPPTFCRSCTSFSTSELVTVGTHSDPTGWISTEPRDRPYLQKGEGTSAQEAGRCSGLVDCHVDSRARVLQSHLILGRSIVITFIFLVLLGQSHYTKASRLSFFGNPEDLCASFWRIAHWGVVDRRLTPE